MVAKNPPLGPAIAVGVGAFFAAVLLAVPAAMVSAFVETSATGPYVAGVVGAAALLPLMARKALGPRALLLACLTLLGVVPILTLADIYALGQPLVSSHWRCGTGDVGLFMLAPFVLAGSIGTSFLFAVVVTRRARPMLDRAVHMAATLAIVALLPLSVAAAWHGRGRPDPDGYVASLPVVATLPPMGSAASSKESIGGVEIERTQIRGGMDLPRCQMKIDGTPAERIEDCDAIEVRRDPRGDILVFLPDRAPQKSAVWPLMAYRLSRARVIDVGVTDVAPLVSAPRGWIATGLAASAFGLLALLGALRAQRSRALAARLTDARHEGGGWLALDLAHARVHVPSAQTMSVGPVAVELRGGGAAAYRTTGAPIIGRVHPGSVADLVRNASDVATGRASLALLALACGLAPLLACVVGGVAF